MGIVTHAFAQRVSLWGRLVAFSHSIFALPFALSMVIVSTSYAPVTGIQLLLLVVAMVSARTGAMSFNRLVDAELDKENPRTKGREIPIGKVSKGEGIFLCAAASLVFIAAAYLLGMHCAVLSLPVLAVLYLYSYAKRFTASSHFWLGLALALAPGGVWYALTATISLEPIPLMTAVLLWVAGFDIIYSCQDVEFDSKRGLYSVPSRFGIAAALKLSLVLHILCILLLIVFGLSTNRGTAYYLGVVLFGGVLLSQHTLVSAKDLSKINQAFFARNGAASFIFLVGTFLDRIVF